MTEPDVIDLDELTRSSMAVCAARLDPTVSAANFVGLLAVLIDAARQSVGVTQSPARSADPPEERPSPRSDGSPPALARSSASGRKLSYDDKTRMRARYAEVMEGRLRAPNGFLDELAAAYNVSISTVKDVLYHGDGT